MKDTNQRLFLAIAIWLACIFGYYTFFAPKKPVPVPGAPAATSQSPKPAVQPPVAAATAPAAAAAAKPAPADVPRGTTGPKPPLQEVVFQTPRARVVVTSEGAAIRILELQGDKWTRHKGAKEESHVDLVGEHAGEALPFSTAVKAADGSELIGPGEAYELVKKDATSATFRAERGGVTLTKTLSVNPANYGVDLAVEVRSTTAMAGQLWVMSGAHAEEPSGGMFGSRSNTPARTICLGGDKKVERVAIGAKHPVYDSAGAQFAGIDDQYFLTAVLPPAGTVA